MLKRVDVLFTVCGRMWISSFLSHLTNPCSRPHHPHSHTHHHCPVAPPWAGAGTPCEPHPQCTCYAVAWTTWIWPNLGSWPDWPPDLACQVPACAVWYRTQIYTCGILPAECCVGMTLWRLVLCWAEARGGAESWSIPKLGRKRVSGRRSECRWRLKGSRWQGLAVECWMDLAQGTRSPGQERNVSINHTLKYQFKM